MWTKEQTTGNLVSVGSCTSNTCIWQLTWPGYTATTDASLQHMCGHLGLVAISHTGVMQLQMIALASCLWQNSPAISLSGLEACTFGGVGGPAFLAILSTKLTSNEITGHIWGPNVVRLVPNSLNMV